MALKDIIAAGGAVPYLLSRMDNSKKLKEKIGGLEEDNAALRAQMEGTQGAAPGMKKGGKVKKMAAGGSASKRADGIATKGKTRGKIV
jgi:hypothetical protein